RRHTYLTSLLGIRHLVVAVNKMDMIGYDEEAFYRIAAAFKQFSNQLNFKTIHFIPVSALHGENIVQGSVHFSWYQGPALLQYLEEINTEDDHFADAARLPVQWVIRPQSDDLHDYRGYAGRLTSGTLRVGDAVGVYPGGQTSRIERIEMYGKDLAEAEALDSIVLHLQDDIDVSRGDIIAPLSAAPVIGQELKARICWMDDEKHLIPGGKYLLQHHGKKVRCVVRDLVDKIQIDTLQFVDAQDVKLNDIATVGIKTASPLALDLYADNRSNGAFILIDEMTCRTVAAGMVLECS
ncbi:MAG TPA: sulfate adenylyltransferase, partial [Saprospiraceae bacterium]|nr:sulfate adenylyltransferase [Saprospiraceae bacterium]